MKKVKWLPLILIFAMLTALFGGVNVSAEETAVYVSASGSDQNSGANSTAPLATFKKAYEKGAENIIVVGSATYSDAPSEYDGTITVTGYTADSKLSLPGTVSIKGNLTINNLSITSTSTIYANGHSLEIGRLATSTGRMTVYGGKNGADIDGDTDIKLYGGKYSKVYGGCNGGNVNGSTYVIVGGDVNTGDNVIEGNSSISPCSIYGGSVNGAVTNSTNITFSDNAVTQKVVGGGYGDSSVVYETNINISGGQALTVIGGASNALTNCKAHITMTGGYVVNVFGGCEGAAMTGSVFITLKGGEVIRRVYSGCYNDTNALGSPKTVSGTTAVEIYPEMVFFKSDDKISSDDKSNRGIFGGSRSSKSSHSGESNTVIFMNGCYSSKKSLLGAQGFLEGIIFRNHINYTVNAGGGGEVLGTDAAGKIYIKPDFGKYGVVDSTNYINETASIGTGTKAVTFADNFKISSLSGTKSETSVTANVTYTAKNVKNENSPRLYIALFDETGAVIDAKTVQTSASDTTKDFTLSGSLEIGKMYTIKAYIWNGEKEPMTAYYETKI